MSENINSNNNSSSWLDWSFGDWMIVFLVALICCNRCVDPVIENTEISNNTEFTQLVFLDSENGNVDGKYICPAMKCAKGGFLSKKTQMLYTIQGADSNAVVSDAFTETADGEFLFAGKLITDTPIVPIKSLGDIHDGETLDISLIEDGDTRIKNHNVTVHNKFYVIPRREGQTFENWMDSCRVAVIDDVNDSYFRAVFITADTVYSNMFIGDYTPSEYEPEEYIAKLNKNAYKERNNTSLQVEDVDISYFCDVTAANVAVTFKPVTDTMTCSFIYHAIYEYNWARTDNNTRFGYQSTTIIPGQTKYEFNITPDYISNDPDDFEKIADLALVGVAENNDLQLQRDFDTPPFWQRVGGIDKHKGSSIEYYSMDYDHRSSFLQKITLRPDLCAGWFKLIVALALAFISVVLLYNNYDCENKLNKILTIIGVTTLVLIIAYLIIWVVLVFF